MELAVKDIVKLLNVSEKTVYRWIQQGVLPAYRINHQYRFNRAEILQWAIQRRVSVSADILSEAAGDAATLPDLAEALEAGGIYYRVGGHDRTSVLHAVVSVLRGPDDMDRDFLCQALLAREALGSTAIGDGIAIPHVRNPIILNVRKASVALCFLEHAVDFGALDGQPVHTLFTVISPTVRAHLHILSRLAFLLRDPEFKAVIQGRALREDILATLRRRETALAQKPGGAAAEGSTT